MLQQYEISGKEKERTEPCSVCKDGEIWKLDNQDDRDKFYDDDRSSSIFEAICSVCETRYLQPKIFKPKLLHYTNLISWRKKILMEMEESKMLTPEILEERETYEDTGIFFEHRFVSSTVKTTEGKFDIQTCLVTRKTKLDYQGKTYLDSLTNILNFLARKGIQHSEQQKKQQHTGEKISAMTVSF